jgi:RNA polymerase sigma-70 factor (ECF subfamily)
MITDTGGEQRHEAELVARSGRGDREAFHELTVRYYRPVCAFLWKRLQQSDVVEDLAQETFLEAYTALKNGTRPARFAAWLFGIAHNRCGKWLRRKRPALFDATEPPDRLSTPAEVDGLAELEEQQRLLARLEENLAGLPDDIRHLLNLKHRQGKTCEEIARELGRPVGTVKSQLARTYHLLRTRLSPAGGEP